MADVKKPETPDARQGSKAVLQSEIKQGYAREISLYEDFFNKVTNHAKTHRQVSINNLNEADKRLKELKGKADKLADSIFFHDEEVVVERSKIISDTERLVHGLNQELIEHDRSDIAETTQSIDYLSKALMQIKTDFIAFFGRSYLNDILSTEDYFDYYLQKSQVFQQTLDRHQEQIYDLFTQLDNQIKAMDDAISTIIRLKNRKVTDIETYFDREAKHYADNQLSFSAESDPTSVEIQALQSDKINQFNAFCEHTQNLNLKIQKAMEDDYASLYRKVLTHLLQSRSYQIINRFDLFEDPLKFKTEYKRNLLNAEANHSRDLRKYLTAYQKICHWQRDIRYAEARATRMLKSQAVRKAQILKLSEETSLRQINQLELYLNEYLEVMKFDPFLAQAIGDYSSKIIKDEIARIQILRLNKELKTNIDYDIQATKIKSQINELELVLMNSIQKQMAVQEGELVCELQKIHLFLLDKRAQLAKSSLAVLKERHLIERLEKATNEHLGHLVKNAALNRRWLSVVSDELVLHTREKETHNIYVVEAKSELELALKQYEIKALHFQTMFENEKNYLMMQKTRVDEGTRVNNEFILTTYQNQMRFAQEQIALADSEYRVRLDSLVGIIDQERKFHTDQIAFLKNRYESDIRLIQDDYQAALYSESNKIQDLVDKKEQRQMSLSMDKERRIRDQKVNMLITKMNDDQVIAKSRKVIASLDARLSEAVADADRLREATIREFTDLYDRAKERYETLKPFMENAVDILDPTFYDSLASINARQAEKLKEAEAELDEKASALLPKYRETFFAEDLADHSEVYRQRIEEIVAERELNQSVYAQKLQAVETAYEQKIAALSREEALIDTDTASALAAARAREESLSQQAKQAASILEKEGEAKIKAHRDLTVKNINRLTDEYAKSLKTSKATIDELSEDFQKLLGGYRDYMRFSEQEAGYRKLLRQIRKAEKRRLRLSLRQLDAKFKKYRIDSKKP